MRTIEKTHSKAPVICVRHGHQSTALLTDDQLSGRKAILCPKCSLEAVPMNMIGFMRAMPKMIAEIDRLRNDIFDLQCDAEERENT